MKPLKRILSIFLAVVMALAVIPFSAYGEENREDKPDVESDLSYKPTNALGGLLTDEIENNQKDADPNYSIHSLEITGNSANVSITSLGECSVVVGIYEKRNGKMLFSGKAKVEAGEAPKNSVVTVNLNTDAMPDYFFVKAFLLASDNSPLCKNYETFEYTEEFEKFKEKTVNDFDSDRVMNLDESIDNNFLVLKDDVKLIDPREGANIVVTDDYENGKYVISNADDSITSLKQGDVFYYKYGEGANDYIITKVGSVDIDGDAVTITKSETDELTDYFQYAKIDTSSTNVTFDDAGMEEGVTHTRLEENDYQTAALDTEIDYSVGDKWTLSKKFDGDITLDFSIIFKLKLSCKIFIDVSFAYFEATLNYNSDIEGELSGKIEFIDIPLGILGVDLSNIGLAADIKPSFVMEGAVKIKVKFSLMEGVLGFALDSNTGFINKNKAAAVELDPELTDAAELFIGLKLKAELEISKQINASIEAKAGLKIKGEFTAVDSSENKHDCLVCIDGTVSFNANCKFKVKIFSWIKNELTLGELDLKIGKFYYSFDIGFGWGRCPNISYKITVTVKDRDGAPVKEAVVNNDYTTDENGIVVIYLKSGEQKITVVTKGGQTAEKTITVANEGKNIEVVVNTKEQGGGDWNKPDIVNGAIEFNGHYYKVFIDSAIGWHDAKMACESYSGHLATIGSADENQAVYDLVKANGISCWLGATDEDEEGVWKWVTDEEWNYNNTYFDNRHGKQHYLVMNYYNDSIWDDQSEKASSEGGFLCNTGGYVCEWEHKPSSLEISLYSNMLRQITNDDYDLSQSSVTLDKAIVGDSYILLIVKDDMAKDLLSHDNLLYIDQITATSATITVEFSLREPFEGYKTIWAGADIGDVLVTPVEPSTETPAESTTVKPTETTTKAPAETTTKVPAEFTTVKPSETTTEPSTEPSTAPSTEPTTKPITEAPTEPSTEQPTETPTKPATSETTTKTPAETTTKVPAESTTVKPSETTTKTPATEPTTEPTTEAPTEPTTEPMSEPASEPASEPSSEPEHEHDYVGVVTKEPTCTEEGVMTYTCSVCGDSYTESIPAKGHTPGDWETVVPPEVGKPGLEQQKCTVCGEVLEEREIPELPGSTGNCVVLPDPDPSTEPEYSLGDVNADGDITASDARIALRISAKLHTPTEMENLASDADKNGSITASDARKILRVSAKLDTAL